MGQRKTEADDVLFPLIDCLNSNTVRDVCWLLGNRKKEIQIVVRFARMCADSVAHLNNATAAANAAAYAAYAAYAAAKKDSQSTTAKICREILGDFIIDEVNKNLIK
jgi:hypothetical protein